MNLLNFLNKTSFLSEKKRIEWYPPFWLMRIQVLELAPNLETVTIKLPLTMFTRNLGGFMFGGCQASLADPVAALACAKMFPGYSVWTRAMHIDFRREGRTDLELRFVFNAQQVKEIRAELKDTGRSTPTFEYGFYQKDNSLCTRIRNTVAIRPKGYKTKSAKKSAP